MDLLKKEILINTSTNETRVAIVEDGKLVEMHLERRENERTIGNIYTGFVENLLPGMNSVFIDIGKKLNGFSHLDDFASDKIPDQMITGVYDLSDMLKPILPLSRNEKEIASNNTNNSKSTNNKNSYYKNKRVFLNKRDKVLVQVVKEQITHKGPRVTSKISIPGRYVVLIPNERGVMISKKIKLNSERVRLKKIVRKLIPDDFGVIVRTAAEFKETESFTKDILDTYSIWKKVIKDFKKSEKAELLYADYNLAESIVRDLFNEDVNRIIVDSEELFELIREYLNNVAPELVNRLEYYSEDIPIFDNFYNISKDHYISLSREVYLKNGGSIVLDHTEALVAIDVNSRRFSGKKSHEENSLIVNLAAAKEIARQLRLRDLGGLVIIDFIDMEYQKNRDKVYQELKNHLSKDKAKMAVEPISRFGLIEMTRQRLKPSIVQTVFDKCPSCLGKGIIKSKESISIQLDSWIKKYKYETNESELEIRVDSELYKFLLKDLRSKILEMKIKYWIDINLVEDITVPAQYFLCLNPKTKEQISFKN